ncbi:hypothetical protein CEXT_796451 [Caerostris extrusa]|uniref:Uncharacterized protein n=1 Tax=Caerostris extrusa TaxID=172846 RepID=A0AAV4S2X4_CAEEX|nr:hypothetical protein CEXT_796451 [Caerostris extrusa]
MQSENSATFYNSQGRLSRCNQAKCRISVKLVETWINCCKANLENSYYLGHDEKMEIRLRSFNMCSKEFIRLPCVFLFANVFRCYRRCRKTIGELATRAYIDNLFQMRGVRKERLH